jgi:glutathionylspermidine synthase
MLRREIEPRKHWQKKAEEFGFNFHTIDGDIYWDERAFYQFSLAQIEQDIEDPTAELHQMCLKVVETVITDDDLMRRFCIPESVWPFIRDSWQRQDPSLYSRMDFSYNNRHQAKLLENNADTPTSLYETGFWQWLWLEDNVDSGVLARQADQYNSLQETLINRFRELAARYPYQALYFACSKDTDEDRGTVQYIEDCAREAGISCKFIFIEDIGLSEQGQFTDLDDNPIEWLFKLYPWEFMFEEGFADALLSSNTLFLEPPWKAILSNKALLPMLWRLYPNHPNLLPAFFEDELDQAADFYPLIKKPLFSREGANISILSAPNTVSQQSAGPYGEEGFIYQTAEQLPQFGESYTLIGSWLIDDQPCAMSIREDNSAITQDSSRFLPHIIFG